MKACVLEGVNRIVYQDIPIVQPMYDEVLLRVHTCGICSSDIDRVYRNGAYYYPIILGHEISGEIVSVGQHVSKELIGQSAVVFPLLPCKKCSPCVNGFYPQCIQYNYFGSRCNGGLAEFITTPLSNIQTFSKKISYQEAALCEPAAVAHHAVKTALSCRHIAAAALVGSGTIAIICGMLLRIYGIENIVFVCRNNAKQHFLEQLGFKAIASDDVDTSSIQFDTVFECVGSNESISTSIKLLYPHSQLILIGNPYEDIRINKNIFWKVLRTENTIRGIWNSSYTDSDNDWKTVLNFMEVSKMSLSPLITHTFSLSQTHKAFETLIDRSVFSIKAVISNG